MREKSSVEISFRWKAAIRWGCCEKIHTNALRFTNKNVGETHCVMSKHNLHIVLSEKKMNLHVDVLNVWQKVLENNFI